ncbi:MAG TPA: hypothetical protein VFO79_11485 [Xanthomonadales bacterium]|nr:hypothetical protein [Xanthomonadales bacterium]
MLNAVCGHFLAQRGSDLAMPMALLRDDGRAIDPCARDCAPLAGRRVAVFVHGLGCDESSWLRDADGGRTYGEALAAELGHVPVYVRYNSGLSIAANGAMLAELLRGVWRAARGRIDELVLVGHSMGGLVARQACTHAARRRHGWLGATRMVVCLGSPHRGAPLPKLVAALPGPLAAIVGALSAGIRDLERGMEDPGTSPVPHRYVAACIAPRGMPGSRWLGDGLVAFDSAAPGRSRANVACVRIDGAHHMQLLNEPRVHAHLRRWLRREPAASGAQGARSRHRRPLRARGPLAVRAPRD